LALISALARLRRIEREAVPIVGGLWRRMTDEIIVERGLCRPIQLLLTNRPDVLATWGVRRARIAIPPAAEHWSHDHALAGLRHELAPIERHDWLVQVSAHVCCAWQWFNPLCWVALRRLRDFGEMACDDEALRSGLRPSDYALRLVEIARACRGSSVPDLAVP